MKGLLATRLPAWVTIAAVAVVIVVLGTVVVVQRLGAVDLGDAVRSARTIEMQIELCNAEVDRHGINPRQAELDLQALFEDEGAEEAVVRVERDDCPED